MKIAFVLINVNRSEGTARAVVEVAERLAIDHDVTLVARTIHDVDRTDLRIKRIGGPGWPEVADFASFVKMADRWLRRQDFDIVHSAGPNTTLADVYTIQTVHQIKVATMREVGFYRDAGWLRRQTRRAYDLSVLATERAAYQSGTPDRPRGFLPVSEGTKRELLSQHPIDAAMLEVIANGADLRRFDPKRRLRARQEFLTMYGWDEEDFIVCFSGGDWQRKGLPVLIEAMERVDDSGVKLLVAGDDPLADVCHRQVEELGLSGRVQFVGFVRNVENIYASSDLFVFPTAYEAFSLATIEAAASGLPVVMPDVSGAAELVGSGQTGMMIQRTADSIAHAIVTYRDDESLRQRHGTAARKLVEDKFNWDEIARRTINFYSRLIASRESVPNAAKAGP